MKRVLAELQVLVSIPGPLVYVTAVSIGAFLTVFVLALLGGR